MVYNAGNNISRTSSRIQSRRNNFMGNISSNPESSSRRPDGLRQLNNSVWELYRPEGVPEMEVIFFHGLQMSDYREAFWKTWRSRDNAVLWPREWLGPELRNARISSVTYNSSVRMTNSTSVTGMYSILENLLQDVVLSSVFKIDPNSKVVLVGHSIGGLIIKHLLLRCLTTTYVLSSDMPAKLQLETFLRNCTGIFYYSTPHGGSELAAYVDRGSHLPKVDHPTICFFEVLSRETARVNNDFRGARYRNRKVATRAIGEVYPTKFAGLSKIVVPESSARFDVDQYYSARADHFEVCKAENRFSAIFTSLLQFCESCTFEGAEHPLDLPAVPKLITLSTASAHATSRPALEAPLPSVART